MIETERKTADAAVEALSRSPQRLEEENALAWDAVRERIRIVRVELRGTDNRLYLDGEATALFLAEPIRTYEVYREQLETTLRGATEGEDARMILFLLREDGRVYRYAWLALLEGVREQIRVLGEERSLYAIAPKGVE